MSLRGAKRRSKLLETKNHTGKQEIASPPKNTSGAPQPQLVVFLSDVFSRYIEPQVEDAALEVLSACGYDVRVLPVVGAGASLLSKGFVDAARRQARKMLKLLNQLDSSREALVVGVEPPEIYLLKSEYADLLPEHSDKIHELAKRVWLLDEFLLNSKEFNDLRVAKLDAKLNPHDLKSRNEQKIFFHPHCHQRAEGSSVNASVELLRACGYDVELSEAGCCGMAGTFGFDAEHYALSMQVGELKLLPRVRELAIGESVAATGAACRMQVRHGTGAEAQHPIEWVRDILNSRVQLREKGRVEEY